MGRISVGIDSFNSSNCSFTVFSSLFHHQRRILNSVSMFPISTGCCSFNLVFCCLTLFNSTIHRQKAFLSRVLCARFHRNVFLSTRFTYLFRFSAWSDFQIFRVRNKLPIRSVGSLAPCPRFIRRGLFVTYWMHVLFTLPKTTRTHSKGSFWEICFIYLFLNINRIFKYSRFVWKHLWTRATAGRIS